MGQSRGFALVAEFPGSSWASFSLPHLLCHLPAGRLGSFLQCARLGWRAEGMGHLQPRLGLARWHLHWILLAKTSHKVACQIHCGEIGSTFR